MQPNQSPMKLAVPLACVKPRESTALYGVHAQIGGGSAYYIRQLLTR
jgi:hypothetical protein